MTREQLIEAMKHEQRVLSKSRDKLRDLMNEIAELKDDATTAAEHLEDAIDALSRTI